MKPVPTCVVGVGRLGAEHARILAELPGARLVGLHDRDAERGEAVGRRVGVPHRESLEALLREARAAVVAVPARAHHAVAVRALEAGCHVLVEKPLALRLGDADDLIRRAEERGLHLGVGHVERFNGVLRACRPHLGGPRYVESLRLAPFAPRGTDVSVVLDLMIHDIDLVLDLVEGEVASVSAVGVPVLTRSVDIANARLVFDSGAVAGITASRVSTEGERRLRLFQPTGYMSLDLVAGRGEFLRARSDLVARMREGRGLGDPGGRRNVRGPGDARAPGDVQGLEDIVERIPLSADGAEPLRLELEAFLRAVRGEPSRSASGREGRAALALALAITEEIEEFADVAVEDP